MVQNWFICVIRVTKHCEICVLQAATIVGLSLAFLATFHELTFNEIPNFSEVRLFWSSRNSLVRHGLVSEIQNPNDILEFRRPQESSYLPGSGVEPLNCMIEHALESVH